MMARNFVLEGDFPLGNGEASDVAARPIMHNHQYYASVYTRRRYNDKRLCSKNDRIHCALANPTKFENISSANWWQIVGLRAKMSVRSDSPPLLLCVELMRYLLRIGDQKRNHREDPDNGNRVE